MQNIRSVSLIVSVFLATISVGAQNNNEQFYLIKDSFQFHIKELRKEFGKNKTIPAEIELECLTALSFYPELKNCSVEFSFGNLHSTMVSRPKLNSLLKQKIKREYVIKINRPGRTNTNLNLQELSFNAIVGWTGHELGHILHYSHKSSGGIVFTGVKYLVPGYRRRMERFTDQLTIQHDLGFALYEGINYTINYSGATMKYKNRQKKFYLQPEEIIARIHSRQAWIAVFRKTKMTKQVSDNLLPLL
jgi:hypothetical protein